MKLKKTIQALGSPKNWLQDDLLLRLFKNAGVLFSGNMAASLLGLTSLAMTARALGVENFGILVLITTYVGIVDKLVNFQTWQAIIKYGADALEQKRDADFKSLVKFGFFLDCATAALGTIIAASAAWFFGQWTGWDQQLVIMATIYSVTILFHVQGTPMAILRLFNKFNKVALLQVIDSAIKLAGVTIVFFAGAGLWAFLLVWAVVDIIGKLLLVYFAYNELVFQRFHDFIQGSVRNIASKFTGIWGFVWTTNIHSSVKLGLKEFDIMIVGFLLGSSSAGLYKIVKFIGSTNSKLTDPLSQAIYPDIARSVWQKNYYNSKRLILNPIKLVAAFSVFFIVVFFFFGELMIEIFFGTDFKHAYPPTIFYLFGTFIATITFSFHPTLLAFGKAHLSLLILSISTLVYLFCMFIFIGKMELIGAALSYMIFYLFWSFMQGLLIIHILKRFQDDCA